jgi:hypothetical protein
MAPCDPLKDAAELAREQAEAALKETKDDVGEALADTGKALGICTAVIGTAAGSGILGAIAVGLTAGEACIDGIWDAATSWCEVRESIGDAGEAGQAAKDAQAAYLACLNDHKRT